MKPCVILKRNRWINRILWRKANNHTRTQSIAMLQCGMPAHAVPVYYLGGKSIQDLLYRLVLEDAIVSWEPVRRLAHKAETVEASFFGDASAPKIGSVSSNGKMIEGYQKKVRFPL
ncbi:hypothetical protein GCM10023157_31400 [Gluconacetobacter asukensis]